MLQSPKLRSLAAGIKTLKGEKSSQNECSKTFGSKITANFISSRHSKTFFEDFGNGYKNY